MDFVYKGRFVWDVEKAEGNPKKHPGITFEIAADAFDYFLFVEAFDKDNSTPEEERFNKTVFSSQLSRYITISYTMRGEFIKR
jgi:uncharacterized DUF497 family protein